MPHLTCVKVHLPYTLHDVGSSHHPEILDMSWEDVCQVFDEICLNWDPQQFLNKLELHGFVCTIFYGSSAGFTSSHSEPGPRRVFRLVLRNVRNETCI